MTLANRKTVETRGRSAFGTIIALLAGPIVWAAHLGVVYFLQSMLCAHGSAGVTVAGMGLVLAIVVLATVVALAILAIVLLAPARVNRALGAPDWRPSAMAFHTRVMIAMAWLSAFGVLWGGLAAFILPACAPLR